MNERITKAWEALHDRKLGECILQLDRYCHGDRASLQAYTEDGEPECSITVNLDEQSIEDDEFFVRFETVRYAGPIFEALTKENIAHPTGRIVSAGYVERYAEVWKLVIE